MTPQSKAIQLISLRIWSENIYKQTINQFRDIINGNDTENIKEQYYPDKDIQWFIDVLWELGEKV